MSFGEYTASDFNKGQRYFVKFTQFGGSTSVIHATYDGEDETYMLLVFSEVDSNQVFSIQAKDIVQVGDG